MIFPRPSRRINERFPRMQIRLRYAVMAAIKVIRVISGTYIGQSIIVSARYANCENNWNSIASNRRAASFFRRSFARALPLVCIHFTSSELSTSMPLKTFLQPFKFFNLVRGFLSREKARSKILIARYYWNIFQFNRRVVSELKAEISYSLNSGW